tara:strand:- start:79 stop:234 length:156 start_codon:yes stop_codon:yes gene_type:complete
MFEQHLLFCDLFYISGLLFLKDLGNVLNKKQFKKKQFKKKPFIDEGLVNSL